jgi:hypothetical protein
MQHAIADLLPHCYNSKLCLPVIPGEGAVLFKTVWFFPHKVFPEAEAKISTSLSIIFPIHIRKNVRISMYIAGRVSIKFS